MKSPSALWLISLLLQPFLSCSGPPVREPQLREPPVREPQRPPPEVTSAAQQPAGSAIIISNETGVPVRYTAGSSQPVALSLAPGSRHSHRVAASLHVTYQRGDLRLQQRLDAGRQYAFHRGRDGGLGLYPRRPPAAVIAPPYVSTPMLVVERMLELAEVGAGDVLYDLGCGDGRIVNTAARRYGARGVGIDIDPDLIARAVAAARAAGTEHLVTFRIEDAKTSDFSEATVVTLYLTSAFNELMRPLLEAQLAPGTRVVAHDIRVPGWQSRQVALVPLRDEGGEEHRLFLYRK